MLTQSSQNARNLEIHKRVFKYKPRPIDPNRRLNLMIINVPNLIELEDSFDKPI